MKLKPLSKSPHSTYHLYQRTCLCNVYVKPFSAGRLSARNSNTRTQETHPASLWGESAWAKGYSGGQSLKDLPNLMLRDQELCRSVVSALASGSKSSQIRGFLEDVLMEAARLFRLTHGHTVYTGFRAICKKFCNTLGESTQSGNAVWIGAWNVHSNGSSLTLPVAQSKWPGISDLSTKTSCPGKASQCGEHLWEQNQDADCSDQFGGRLGSPGSNISPRRQQAHNKSSSKSRPFPENTSSLGSGLSLTRRVTSHEPHIYIYIHTYIHTYIYPTCKAIRESAELVRRKPRNPQIHSPCWGWRTWFHLGTAATPLCHPRIPPGFNPCFLARLDVRTAANLCIAGMRLCFLHGPWRICSVYTWGPKPKYFSETA